VFKEVNVLNVNPSMPYHDPRRPMVKAWFSSSDAPNVRSFCELLSEPNQDRLEAEGGVCIAYTHLACGFVQGGKVHPRVVELLRRLSRKRGWFIPVSTVLDYLRVQRGTLAIPRAELASMERRWLWDRITLAMPGRRTTPSSLRELCNASV
jgi:hypothetical protein